MTYLRATLLASVIAIGYFAACTPRPGNDCEASHTCSPPGDGDGDLGGAPSDGGNTSGGSGGNGDGDTGGDGGTANDPCDECGGDTPACNDDEECVECTEDDVAACDVAAPLCNPTSETCVECLGSPDCTDPAAALCDAGACAPCEGDTDCERFEDTPVCDEDSGTCVECTGDTEESLCGEFSCSSLTHTCTMTTRGLSGICEPCEADSECAVDRKCVMDQFGGEDVGYFCFFEQGVTGCGNVEASRRPYRTIVETTSLDGEGPENFCLPPNSTTCQGIQDTQDVSCDSDDDCGMDGAADGYCPTVGDGAGLCTYTCTGGVECVSGLECTDAPQHCNPT